LCGEPKKTSIRLPDLGRVMTTDELLQEMRTELGRNDRLAAE
jgi:hypothetical protein